jgi:hypothetical protein
MTSLLLFFENFKNIELLFYMFPRLISAVVTTKGISSFSSPFVGIWLICLICI